MSMLNLVPSVLTQSDQEAIKINGSDEIESTL